MKVHVVRAGSRRGSFIIEASLAWGVMLVIALMALKGSITVTTGQRWTVVQAMTDAFMTQESALGTRWPYDDLQAADTPWPTYPAMSNATVEVGQLPGGVPVTATLRRTKVPDANNLPAAGGSGDGGSNPAAMEAWKLQSMVVYQVANREYVKARTTLRVR